MTNRASHVHHSGDTENCLFQRTSKYGHLRFKYLFLMQVYLLALWGPGVVHNTPRSNASRPDVSEYHTAALR